MRNFIGKYKSFFHDGIWRVQKDDVSATRYFLVIILKRVLLSLERFTTRGVTSRAAALTYSTLLAIVPILAVFFAIARGFGYNKYIETWFRDVLASQPQVAETIIGFVNSYLVHTKSGVFLGVGLLFMLFTVIMLITNIEKAFNEIWQVEKPRSVFRTVTDYISMFLLVPIIIVTTSGISIFIAAIAENMHDFILLAPIMKFLLELLPYLFMSAIFTALYIFMPNTSVKFTCAIVPGILAGVAMQGLQLIYIHSQIWVSSYNAIYGSFAALPMFMLWVQISWVICLFGAELCYANQNMEYFAFRAKAEDISHKYKLMLCVLLASHICRRFEHGKQPYTALQLKLLTNIPIRVTKKLLHDLCRLNIIVEVSQEEKGEESVFVPAQDLSRLTVGMLIDRIESYGKWMIEPNLKPINRRLWIDVIGKRQDYLTEQRNVLLKDMLKH